MDTRTDASESQWTLFVDVAVVGDDDADEERSGTKKRVVNVNVREDNLARGTFTTSTARRDSGVSLLGWVTYGRTKMANILFTFELDRRLKAASPRRSVNAVHPESSTRS